MSEIIPLEGLLQTRAGFLLCYPRYDDSEAERRLRELSSLEVRAVELRGRHKIRGVPVLGKGHVGIVVAARLDGHHVALKIRREDADRESLVAEGTHLKVANRVSVGPKFHEVSPNFLLMELVDGDYIVNWMKRLEPSDGGRLRRVLKCLLDKVRRLDAIGLDHGELSRAHRHVIVMGDDPRIVDWESASTTRRCANVTSLSQYLFFNSRMRGLIDRVIQMPERDELLEALGRYKRTPTDTNYRRLLEVCGLAA